MSLSIRTLKIIIGITVLISMLLSMVPMFGAMLNSAGRMARQAGRTIKPMPAASLRAPVSAVPRSTSYIPQATKRPVGVPAYNVSPKETYEFGTLGVALPTFPQAPTPISVTVPELPKLPATALLPGSSLGVQNPVEFAPEIKPVEQPAVQEAEVKEVAAQESKPEKGLFMKVLTQEIPKPETAPVVEEPVPTKPAPKHDLKIVLPKKSEPTIAPAEEIEILDDGTVKKFTEPQSVTEVTPVTSVVQTRAAEITQPTTEQAALTPASNHNEIEQRAEVVHAPVVGKVESEEGILKPGIVIDAPFKIERVEREAEPVHFSIEKGATRVPQGELGRAVSAMPQAREEFQIKQIERPAVEQAPIIQQGAVTSAQGVFKSAEVTPEPIKQEQTRQSEASVEHGPAVKSEPQFGIIKSLVPEAHETIKQEKTKEADVDYAIVKDTARVGSSQAPTISANTDVTTAAATTAASIAPIVGTAVTAEPLQGVVKIIPESVSGLERTVIVPEKSVVIDTTAHTGKTTSNTDSIKRRPRPKARTHISTQHGSVKNELGKRGTTTDVLRDTKPEELRRQVTPEQIEQSRIEKNSHGGRRGPNRPAPLRPRPAVMLPAAPAVVPDSIYCPVIPPLNPENEPVVDTDAGSVRPLPMPVEPRPTNIPVVQPANNLPPARVQRRSAFDDLEDKVIRDKNAAYNEYFENVRRGESVVAQVLPSLSNLPSSLEQLAYEFINAYKQVNKGNQASYDEFISEYNEIMEAIRNEREKAQ